MFNEKVAIVTGAACHTGYAVAELLLSQGATVYVCDIDQQQVADAVEKLGGRARAAVANLADPEQIRAMASRVLAEAGRVDILVNNACQHGIGPDFLHTPMEVLEQVLAVNVRGMFLLSQLVATDMARDRRGGCIVNISSNTSKRAIRNRASYVASKGAIDSLTLAMAIELAPLGIRVNAVSPGYIVTTRWERITEKERQRRLENIPLGIPATPSDIAQTVVYLCSPAARNIVGANIVVDGGSLAQLTPADVEA